MPLKISICGDVTEKFPENLKTERSDCEINIIPPNDIQLFDDAIYESDTLVISSVKVLSSYLAEWRADPLLQKKRVYLLSKPGDPIDVYLKAFAGYRENLPDEKNPEAKNSFLYLTKKVNDFFIVVQDEEELIKKLKTLENKSSPKTRAKNITEIEFKKLKEKFPKADIYESYEAYCLAKKDRKPGIFVPAFASDNLYAEELAFTLGKTLTNFGFRVINGGSDGGQKRRGPMWATGMGALAGDDPELFSVYSFSILDKYVSPASMDCFFKNTSIVAVVPEGQRKKIMLDESKGMVALPGAIGTMAEIENAIMKGLPVILIEDKSIHNGKGYWKFFLDYLQDIGLRDRVTVVYYQENFQDQLASALMKNNITIPNLSVNSLQEEKAVPLEMTKILVKSMSSSILSKSENTTSTTPEVINTTLVTNNRF